MDFQVVAADLGFLEGPTITQQGDVLVTSIDRGRVYRVTRDGSVSIFAVTGGGPNGAAEGPDGIVYVAQNGGTSPAHPWPNISGGIQVINAHGKVDWLTLNPVSPNDLCFGPDGLLYVTDPTRRPARDDGRLWRCDVRVGEAELLTSVPYYPNGIAFGVDADAFFVASTGDGIIWRYPVSASGIGPGEVAVRVADGLPDGMAIDAAGNIIIAVVGLDGAPGEIRTYEPSGTHLDSVCPGPSSKYTNLALGSDRTMFVTDADTGSVLSAQWPVAGMPLHPFRSSE